MPSFQDIVAKIKGDIFPIFIVSFIVGIVGFMLFSGYPIGIIVTMAALGIAFGLVELLWKCLFKKTVSQEWWKWANKTAVDQRSKYLFCPHCGTGIALVNKWKSQTFAVLFIMSIVIITVGHLLWK